MNAAFSHWTQEALGALISGMIPGLALALCVAPILKRLKGMNAATRHAILFFCLLAVLWLPFHWLIFKTSHAITPAPTTGLPQFQSGDLNRPNPNLVHDLAPLTLADKAGPAVTRSWRETLASDDGRDLKVDGRRARIAAGALSQNGSNVEHEKGRRSIQSTRIENPVRDFVPSRESANASSNESNGANGSNPLADWFAKVPSFLVEPVTWKAETPAGLGVWLALLWMLGSLWLGGRLFLQYGKMLRIKSESVRAPEDLERTFQTLLSESGTRRNARLFQHSQLPSPVACGFFKPAILLPSAFINDVGPVEIRQILRHELAHLSRRDDWTNLIQQLGKSLFFFHPAVPWLCARLEIEREIACDDFVLRQEPKPQAYALFLTDLAGRALNRNQNLAAPSAWKNNSQIKERIAMILNSNRNKSTCLSAPRTALFLVLASAFALWSLQAGPQITFAKSADESSDRALIKASASSGSSDVVFAEGKVVATRKAAQTPPAAPALASEDASNPLVKPKSARTPLPPEPPAADAVLAPPMQTPPPVAHVHAEIPERDPSLFAAKPPPPASAARVDFNVRQIEAEARAIEEAMEKRLERLERMIESLVEQKVKEKEAKVKIKEHELLLNRRGTDLDHALHEEMFEFKHAPDLDIDVEIEDEFGRRPKVRISRNHNADVSADIQIQHEAEARIQERANREARDSHVRRFRSVEPESVPVETQQQLALQHALERQRDALNRQSQALKDQLEALQKEIHAVEQRMQEFNESQSDRFDSKAKEKQGTFEFDESRFYYREKKGGESNDQRAN